jgi:hypothetical protein
MKILNRAGRVFIIGAAALTIVGCEAAFDDNPGPTTPGINPDPVTPGGPKRPVPIKPKRNPDGKIQRPKLVEDLINQIVLTNAMSYDDSLIDEPR